MLPYIKVELYLLGISMNFWLKELVYTTVFIMRYSKVESAKTFGSKSARKWISPVEAGAAAAAALTVKNPAGRNYFQFKYRT